MNLYENSMYSDPAGRAALVADIEKVTSLFFANFLGFIGLYALNDSRGYMKDFEKTEKKLMIGEIGDENHDVSLIIKLAVDASLLAESKAMPLTRFLALVKQRKIRSADIDSAKIREMIEATHMHFKPMLPAVKAVVKPFMDGTFDVKEYSRQIYDVVKKPELRDFTLELRNLIIKGQYTDYFTVMKRNVAANGHTPITAVGAKTSATAASQPAAATSAAAKPVASQSPQQSTQAAAKPAHSFHDAQFASEHGFANVMAALDNDRAAVALALKLLPPIKEFEFSAGVHNNEYYTWGAEMLLNRVFDDFLRHGNWSAAKNAEHFNPASASLASALIGRVASAVDNKKLSIENRIAAWNIYTRLQPKAAGWSRRDAPVAATSSLITPARMAEIASAFREGGISGDRSVVRDFVRELTSNNTTITKEFNAFVGAWKASSTPISINSLSWVEYPWTADILPEVVNASLRAYAKGSNDSDIPPPVGSPIWSRSKNFAPTEYSKFMTPVKIKAANLNALNSIGAWLTSNDPLSVEDLEHWYEVARHYVAYAQSLGSEGEALMAGMRALASPKDDKNHRTWFLSIGPAATLDRDTISPAARNWIEGVARNVAVPEGVGFVSVNFGRKLTAAEIASTPPATIAQWMADNFNAETIASTVKPFAVARELQVKISAWDPALNPVTPYHLTDAAAELVKGNAPWTTFLALQASVKARENPMETGWLYEKFISKDGVVAEGFVRYANLIFSAMAGGEAHEWLDRIRAIPMTSSSNVQKFLDSVKPLGLMLPWTRSVTAAIDVTKPLAESNVQWLLVVTNPSNAPGVKAHLGSGHAVMVGDSEHIPHPEVAEFFEKYGSLGIYKLYSGRTASSLEEYAADCFASSFKQPYKYLKEEAKNKLLRDWTVVQWADAFVRAADEYGFGGYTRAGWFNTITNDIPNARQGIRHAIANSVGVDAIRAWRAKNPTSIIFDDAGDHLNYSDITNPLTDTAKELVANGALRHPVNGDFWLEPQAQEILDHLCSLSQTNQARHIDFTAAMRTLADVNQLVYLEAITRARAIYPKAARLALLQLPPLRKSISNELAKELVEAWTLDGPAEDVKEFKENVEALIKSNKATTIPADSVKCFADITPDELKVHEPYISHITDSIQLPTCILLSLFKEAYQQSITKSVSSDLAYSRGVSELLTRSIPRPFGSGGQEPTDTDKDYFEVYARGISARISAGGVLVSEKSFLHLDTLAQMLPTLTNKMLEKKIREAVCKDMVTAINKMRTDEIDFVINMIGDHSAAFFNDAEVMKTIVTRLASSTAASAASALATLAYTQVDGAVAGSNMAMPTKQFVDAVRSAGKEKAVARRLATMGSVGLAVRRMNSDPNGLVINFTTKQATNFFRYNDVILPDVTGDVTKFEDLAVMSDELANEVPKLAVEETTTPEVVKNAIRELHKNNRYNHHPALGLEVKRAFKVNLPGQKERFDAWVDANPDTKIMTLFHGCGTMAAQFLLRYGFRIIKTTGDPLITARMLGDGIYFADNVNKSMLYMSNSGYIQAENQEGYLFKCRVALGKSPKDHKEGFREKRGLVSNEWAVYDLDQICIEEAYYGFSRRVSTITVLLNEATGNFFPSASSFIFMDGKIPVGGGEYVDFVDFAKTAPAHVTVETTAVGPMVIIGHTQDFAERQACYLYGTDCAMSGDEAAFLSLVANTY